MPRYFIDFVDDDTKHIDTEGSFIRSIEVARTEAVLALIQTARDKIKVGFNQQFSASVQDEAGEELYRAWLTFEEEDFTDSKR